jgi:murein hydrolase activator
VLALLNGADTLDAFASSLTGREAQEVGADAFAAARGRLPLPVEGVLLSRLRRTRCGGRRAPRPPPRRRAPRARHRAMARDRALRGPLLDYGNVVILEPEAGYLLVLAGLGDLFATTGMVVRGDDPLGLMAGQPEPAQGNLIAARMRAVAAVRKRCI